MVDYLLCPVNEIARDFSLNMRPISGQWAATVAYRVLRAVAILRLLGVPIRSESDPSFDPTTRH